MKKEMMYLLEFLRMGEQADIAQIYFAIANGLENALLYVPSRYTPTKIHALMRHGGYGVPQTSEEAIKRLDTLLENSLPENLIQGRKAIYHTLLRSNFPKQKSFLEHSLALFESQLEPVQKSIYQNISTYVICLNRALALFFTLDKKSSPESLVFFSQSLHVSLFSLIFNEEEKAFLAKGLQELMGVYVGLYGKYLYQERIF